MRTLFVGLLLSASCCPALGDWDALTAAPVDLLDESYAPAATVPAGTAVHVGVCFKNGTLCMVDAPTGSGVMDASKLVTTYLGRQMTVTEAEQAFWSALLAPAPGPAASSDIVAWGDSLTFGTGASPGHSYPEDAEALFGGRRHVENLGIGGQTSTQIAARMNAIPIRVTVAGGVIPAGATVSVPKKSVDILLTSRRFSGKAEGTLCGIAGTMSADSSGAWTFARRRPGEATPCPAGSTFTTAAGEAALGRVAWLWLGRNGSDPVSSVQSDIAAAVAMTADRYLVGSILPSTDDSPARIAAILKQNEELEASYGDHYVDLLGALVAASASDAAAGDESDQAVTTLTAVPASLRTDLVHLNDEGYAIVARTFHDATVKLGY
jgi:lysophospholipase L1-like esterase